MSFNFSGRGTPLTADDFDSAVDALGCDAPTLWSLVAVETRGFGFLPDRRPKILFERHIFRARTGARFDRDFPDLSNSVRGGYFGGAAEYERLGRAMLLDERAALESTSWGLGQIMGFNYRSGGFGDAYGMVGAIVNREAAHLQAMVSFIRDNASLLVALQTRAWDRVAFYYNGAAYQEKHYDDNLAQHYAIFSSGKEPSPDVRLRIAQVCLTYLGFLSKGVDGIWGPASRSALLAYGKSRGIENAVVLEQATLDRLAADANI